MYWFTGVHCWNSIQLIYQIQQHKKSATTNPSEKRWSPHKEDEWVKRKMRKIARCLAWLWDGAATFTKNTFFFKVARHFCPQITENKSNEPLSLCISEPLWEHSSKWSTFLLCVNKEDTLSLGFAQIDKLWRHFELFPWHLDLNTFWIHKVIFAM